MGTFLTRLELEEIVHGVQKTIEQNNKEIRDKVGLIESLKADLDVRVLQFQNEKAQLTKELEDRNKLIMKQQHEIAQKNTLLNTLQLRVKDLMERYSELEHSTFNMDKPKVKHEAGPAGESSETALTHRKCTPHYPRRILKVEKNDFFREYKFDPIENEKGTLTLNIFECGHTVRGQISIEVGLIHTLIQTIALFETHSDGAMRMDLSVKNKRQYSIEIISVSGEDPMLRICTGPSLAYRIQIPKGVEGKFKCVLRKYAAEAEPKK